MNGTLCHKLLVVMPFSTAYNCTRSRYDDNAQMVLVNLESIDIQWQPHPIAAEEILLKSIASNNGSVRIMNGQAV